MSPIHHHFELVGVARVHRDRPVLDHRRALRRGRARRVLRGLHRPRRTRLSGRFAGGASGRGRRGGRRHRLGASAVGGGRRRPRDGDPSGDRRAGRRRAPALGVEVRTGGHDPSHLEGATLVVTGPGVPPDAEVLRWARERGLPIWGEMELGARLARAPYLAVTGTNGKTTVTAMIEACLRAGGRDALACGNIGLSFPEAALQERDVLVVEVSSFQLAVQTSFHPTISVLLNVAPDHLDWHGSLEAYSEAKGRTCVSRPDPTCTSATATILRRRRSPRGRRASFAGSVRGRRTKGRSATWGRSSSPGSAAPTGSA